VSNYVKALKAAAEICRLKARQNIPYRQQKWDPYLKTVAGSVTNLGRKERALSAIRCAQAIEQLAEQCEGLFIPDRTHPPRHEVIFENIENGRMKPEYLARFAERDEILRRKLELAGICFSKDEASQEPQ
jgi:hypothetical protein